MAYNFLRGDRDQPFLLPPDLRLQGEASERLTPGRND
jgi:hypothetical protein